MRTGSNTHDGVNVNFSSWTRLVMVVYDNAVVNADHCSGEKKLVPQCFPNTFTLSYSVVPLCYGYANEVYALYRMT